MTREPDARKRSSVAASHSKTSVGNSSSLKAGLELRAMLAFLPTSKYAVQLAPLQVSSTGRDAPRKPEERGSRSALPCWVLTTACALRARPHTRRSFPRRTPTARAVPVELFPVPIDPEIKLEVLGGLGEGAKAQPLTLLLIHGSYHAAWCYEENFLSFFRKQGFHTYALSLRGQGNGKMPNLPAVAGTLEEHASDVEAYLRHLRDLHGQPVVLLGHSFGGLMVLKAATGLKDGALAGLILLNSVPPAGNVGIILRSLFNAPLQALRITWGFVARAFERDVGLCQEARFQPTKPTACSLSALSSFSSTPTLLWKMLQSTWS